MSDISPARRWCDAIQQKLMDAIDAAWALAEGSDDPEILRRARDKARAAGQIAATARKVAALDPPPAKAAKPLNRLDAVQQAVKLLDSAGAHPAKPPEKPQAAQAVAMRAALEKLKRR